MKINFRKIASVLAATVMLGGTIAFASAAWPAPFVNNGAADAALVIGAAAPGNFDNAAALDVANALNAAVTVNGGTTIAGEGDKIKLDRASDKINLGDGISTAWGTSLTKTNLPVLLADGVFNNKQNSEYKYNQKFDIGNLSFTHFSDSDYNNRVPTIGFKINANDYVANYTLSFVTNPESACTAGNLDDFENKNINIMGKNYYILDFKNSSNGKLTLLDAASSSSISGDDTTTVSIGDKSYAVAIKFITTDQIILTVNGVDTEKLSATGTTYGNTYKLADGTYVGIKNINVNDYAGGSKSVDFSLGVGKLEITGGAGSVKINDKAVDDLTAGFVFGDSSGKTTWQKMWIQWRVSDKQFLTSGKELVMPGFGAIKLTVADPTIDSKEITTVEYGSTDYYQLKTTIKDGSVTIPILYMSSTTGNFTNLGQSATQRLATTNNSMLVYNATSGTPQYDGFVASWASTKDSESYYLKATVRYDSDGVRNLTTIKNKVTGDTLCEDLKILDTCTIGNIVLTVSDVRYNSGGDRMVNLSINSGGSFQKLYTANGVLIYLPVVGDAATGATINGNSLAPGRLNLTVGEGTYYPTSFQLQVAPKDKDGTIAAGRWFNITLGPSSGSGSAWYATVSDVVGESSTFVETTTSSKLWEAYVYSDIGTKFTWDKTNSNQYFVKSEDHGTQMYANVYVAAPSVTSTSAGDIKVFKDSEVASVSDKNLVIVGGSCINKAAAMFLNGNEVAMCGAAFTAKTTVGAGQWLVQAGASPYNNQKIAMLVAGFEAAQTADAASYVKEGKFTDTTVGQKKVGPVVA